MVAMIYVFLFHYLPRPFFYRKSWALFNYKGLAGLQLLLKMAIKTPAVLGTLRVRRKDISYQIQHTVCTYYIITA